MIELDSFVEEIKTTEVYQEFKEAEELISQDQKIETLIAEIKQLQKQSIIKPSLKTNQELEDKFYELQNNPKYIEYLNKLDKLNEYNQSINNELNNYFNNLIELEK